MLRHQVRARLLKFKSFAVSVTIDVVVRVSMDDAEDEGFDYAALMQGF